MGAELLRRIGLVVGVLLIVLFISFSRDIRRVGDETHDVTTVGAWFSPWYVSTVIERTATAPPAPGEAARSYTASLSDEWTIEFLSWSWVVLGAGIALVFVSRPRAEIM